MEEYLKCPICIRECSIGSSFCRRRDENGLLKQRCRFNAVFVDSLFDKPVIHFKENTKVLSIGSWGCNFRCLGCQNASLSWSETGCDLGYREMTADDVIKLALEKDCHGICFTFNEPAILLEMVDEVASNAREHGLFNVLVTNSTLSEKSTKRISGNIDAVAADIKSLGDDFYYKYCGAEGIRGVADKILKCIRTFHDSGNHIEVRTNIIPGANDQIENFHDIASWIGDNLGRTTPWHITRFFPAHRLNHLWPTSSETLREAQKAGIEEGLKFVHIYPDKGCDCAKEAALIKQQKEPETASSHCCCKE